MVNVTYEWCCKWRLKANVGPNKSAVMLFNPQSAPTPLVNGDVMSGEEPLPVVDKYKYLGVMLATDCTWHAHVEHVVAKATKASYTWVVCFTIASWTRRSAELCCWQS